MTFMVKTKNGGTPPLILADSYHLIKVEWKCDPNHARWFAFKVDGPAIAAAEALCDELMDNGQIVDYTVY